MPIVPWGPVNANSNIRVTDGVACLAPFSNMPRDGTIPPAMWPDGLAGGMGGGTICQEAPM